MDYPRTPAEFDELFGTEDLCWEYLIDRRWPEGFRCPRCKSGSAWLVREMLFECKGCGHQTSATSGTVFHGSHLPLSVWFRAAWWMTGQKSGVSALGLQRILGLGSYRTAWMMLHKLRRAMVRPGRDKLAGRVEVDETYWGAPESGRHGRRLGKKALIVIAAQENGKGIGRIRMQMVKDAKAESLHGFIVDSIEPGSVVHTDGWQGYAGLEKKGYKREVTEIANAKGSASDLMPRVHRVASLLKRWFIGTHQGSVSHEHLQGYLNEFTFRFNRRTSRNRGMLFLRLIEQAAQVCPAPYETLNKGSRRNS